MSRNPHNILDAEDRLTSTAYSKSFITLLTLLNALKDEHKRVWLAKCGRTLLADFIRHTKQDPVKFFNAYDEMLEYVSNDRNQEQLRQDVEGRGVCETGFYDVAPSILSFWTHSKT
ncbi:hypothetical protein L3Y34_007743 [Caenorhabditis briggsae]|uniref:Uncharacterized protein n=1 Tax=Caenorhabditis briggsae TaxID=6238 RepID=A0AAE8ZXM2_CAEBR|nr:hypothetical protein L3Y34_007743 [Caenorhabditis briggsae]